MLLYSQEHEWVDVAAGTVGITAFAADALGDIVYVELPAVGAEVIAGEVCGEVESTKSVSELYAPVSGTIVEVNSEVVADPSLIGADPAGKGWLYRLTISHTPQLMSEQEYQELIS